MKEAIFTAPQEYKLPDDPIKPENEPLVFTPEQEQEIEHKRRVLSSLAYFIGKDFEIPVELNEPGAGWHWNFKKNEIRVDPKDLLEKDMDYLRFVISHEGGHRRITRADFIPLETWRQPGFAFMMNAIEDPRMNNFVAESYPKFREQMHHAYEQDIDVEKHAEAKAKDKLGYKPRFVAAGFEYIKQWFHEVQDQPDELSDDIPPEVAEVVKKTLAAARDSWWRYPSRSEADESEELIRRYAERSYEINRDRVWPEFQKLVEQDLEDQKLQEMLQQMAGGEGESQPGEGGSADEKKDQGTSSSIPQELQDQLSHDEQKALENALDNAKGKGGDENQEGKQGGERDEEEDAKEGAGKPASEQTEQQAMTGGPKAIDLDSLPEGLKQKVKAYIDALPEDQKQKLGEQAKATIREFEEELSKELEGKLSENPEEHEARMQAEKESLDDKRDDEDRKPARRKKLRPEEVDKYRDMVEEVLSRDANVYEKKRREVLPVIDKLEQQLREVFAKRRASRWETGHKTGKRIDIKRRIQEKAKGVPAVESKAWQRREAPQEKDYAITLLVDLSNSMWPRKIDETFKAAIVLSEVLNRLSIKTEVLGFNDRLHEYQSFGQQMSKEVRERMGSMLMEANPKNRRSMWNDDGFALEQASIRLARQREKEKFLLSLSDGEPVESPAHSGDAYDLSHVVEKIIKGTDQHLIGLGIGPGTGHVDHYYPKSLANVNLDEMAERLATVIREAIENYDKF